MGRDAGAGGEEGSDPGAAVQALRKKRNNKSRDEGNDLIEERCWDKGVWSNYRTTEGWGWKRC